jgi:hypothetical protein
MRSLGSRAYAVALFPVRLARLGRRLFLRPFLVPAFVSAFVPVFAPLLLAVIATAACDPADGGAPAVIEPGAPVVVESDDAPPALAAWGMCGDGTQAVVQVEDRRISLVCPEGSLRLRALCEGTADVTFTGGLVRVGCVRSLGMQEVF